MVFLGHPFATYLVTYEKKCMKKTPIIFQFLTIHILNSLLKTQYLMFKWLLILFAKMRFFGTPFSDVFGDLRKKCKKETLIIFKFQIGSLFFIIVKFECFLWFSATSFLVKIGCFKNTFLLWKLWTAHANFFFIGNI